MNWILQKVMVEVCTGPSLTRGPRTRPGPGRQIKVDFSNGTGRAGNWEVIFPTGRAGPEPKKSTRADL